MLRILPNAYAFCILVSPGLVKPVNELRKQNYIVTFENYNS